MTKTIKIEGMMCGHCEARVKKCLEALAEVEEAIVSHEAGTAVGAGRREKFCFRENLTNLYNMLYSYF